MGRNCPCGNDRSPVITGDGYRCRECADDTESHEYHRPGNYYLMEGTWVRRPRSSYRDLGVVASIDSHGPESPRDGSINILWFPDSSEHLSATSFRQQLQTGRLVVDVQQHPYDKVSWEVPA